MAENIRPEYPAVPTQAPASKGNVPNVGAGPDPAVIRPQNPGAPTAPVSSQGAFPNVVGPTKRPNVGRDA